MAYRTVLDTLFHALVRWAAPVLVFTAEEVWGTRYPEGGSVHLLEWPEVDAAWNQVNDAPNWSGARHIRGLILAELEALRRDKVIGSSLEADVHISASSGLLIGFPEIDFAELAIVASVEWRNDPALPDFGIQKIVVTRTTHHKCGRCWRHLPEVTEDGALCSRCDQVVRAMEPAE
jgi:isoleucyl-tRNA synthetase